MKMFFRTCLWLLVCLVAAMWAFHIIPNLQGQMNRGRPDLLLVLLPETAATLGLGFLILWLDDRRPLARLLFVPFGMAMMAMVHGLFFFTDGSPDIGMYVGFGMVSGLFLGTPLGVLLTLIDWVARRSSPK
jgi:hypothetical protein